jgi:hypothetical protein
VVGGVGVIRHGPSERPDRSSKTGRQCNIYVASLDGKQIRMGNTSHCAETLFAEDHQTVGCLVEVKGRVQNPEEAPFSLQLEIHGRGGDKRTIEPGARIHEWHFWKDGEAVAVASGMSTNAEHYALYESATGHLVEELPAPPEENMLPQWAKSRTQIDDESVPMSPSLTEERARWLARVLREIQKIQPGMHRRDLIPTSRQKVDFRIAFAGLMYSPNARF